MNERINIHNHVLNENWPEAMKISLTCYKFAENKLRDAVAANAAVDSDEIAEDVLRCYIDLLKVSCEMFDNYKDCIKDAYEVLDEMMYYVPLSLDEQRVSEEQKNNLSKMYDMLSDSIIELNERTLQYEKTINNILEKSITEELPPEIEQSCVREMSDLTKFRNGVFVYCSDIIAYIENVKQRVDKYKEFMFGEEDEQGSDDCDTPFLS